MEPFGCKESRQAKEARYKERHDMSCDFAEEEQGTPSPGLCARMGHTVM
jgi:hypothetical protein